MHLPKMREHKICCKANQLVTKRTRTTISSEELVENGGSALRRKGIKKTYQKVE